MATITLGPIRVARNLWKQGVKYGPAGEESSQDFKAGCPLVLDGTTKELEEWAGTTDATLLNGFAAQDASGTAGTDCPYYEANPGHVFEGNFKNGTADLELTAAHLDVDYSLLEDATTQYWVVDQNDTSTKLVHVIGPARGSAIGDTNARVRFRVLTDKQANIEDA